MPRSPDRSGGGQAGRDNRHDMQIDAETGLPVPIVPDGEKENQPGRASQEERLRIDPESRIPRPVQPDLA